MASPWLSVVIPTYNEAANIGPLLTALREALGPIEHEVIVVDDDSKDATVEQARLAAPQARLIVRKGERGLATAVVRGLREARGTHVAVMDADFQHPPEAVRKLFEMALATDADLVIGSRYAQGGSEGNFGPFRRLLSGGASLIGKVLLPPIRRFEVTDPMSGLFLVKRDRVDPDALRPQGYKILLEILGRCPLERVAEVPYTFQDRRGGDSKLGAGVIADYLRHVAELGLGHPENHRIARFGLVGLSGVVVNLALLYLLHGLLGWHDLLAVPIAIEASILSNFLLNDRFTFRDRHNGSARGQRLLKFNAVSLVALAVNLLAYTILAKGMGIHYLVAEAIAILVAFGANYSGNLNWTYGGAQGFSLRRFGRGLVPFVPVFLVASAAGTVYLWDIERPHEVYFDEHYYISVARQMDNGIWEDPCWTYDPLNHRPLNYEHPPLAKLLIYWSVSELDTDHAVFQGDDPGPGHRHPGCRNPDDATLFTSGQCNLVEHGRILATYDNNKDCYNAFTQRARDEGNALAWRLPSAVFGIATVLFAGLAAQRIFGTPFAGALASTLVLLDTLVLGSSRIAILDIFSAGFTMAAVWAATFPSRRGILATAVLLGLGFASKYSVVFVGPAILVLLLWVHRRHGLLTRRRFDLALGSFIVTPLVVWVLSFWPWWSLWIRQSGFSWAVRHWLDVQKVAFGWGVGGYADHPYATPPGMWFTVAKPTWYYHVWGLPGGKEGWVYAIGNPLLWWIAGAVVLGALLAIPLRWVWALRAGWEHPIRHAATLSPRGQAIVVTALLPAFAYAGFFLVDRATFLFYMTLIVPLLCLPLAGALDRLWRGDLPQRLVVAAALGAVLLGFLVYYPVATTEPLTCQRYLDIMEALPYMEHRDCFQSQAP